MMKFEYDPQSHGFSYDKVTFEFDSISMPASEVFMRWVRFMNAIGYELDTTEMEAMWNGERHDD